MPQHRRRLLREVSRPVPRRSFGVSHREIRRSTALMFNFTPLSSLSQLEIGILKKRATRLAIRSVGEQTRVASDLQSGNSKLSLKGSMHYRRAKQETIRKLFTRGNLFNLSTIREKSDTHTSPGIAGSRGLKEYPFDVLKEAREARIRLGRTVRVLDVGSNTAQMLGELKAKMRTAVETHSMGPQDVPRSQVDAHHHLMAEYMPAEFRRRFDLIISNRMLEYSLLPNIALQNISQSLAKGGKAFIECGRIANVGSFGEKSLIESAMTMYAKYSKATLREQTIDLVRSFYKKDKIPTVNKVRKDAEQARIESPFATLVMIAWVNEIAQLVQLKELQVTILAWSSGPFGPFPSHLSIERLN